MLIEPLVLGDSLELLIDNRGKNPPYVDAGIPAVSGASVRPGVLDLSESRFVSVDTWKQWMPNQTRRNDVIMTSEAPLGRVALVPDDQPLLVAQRVFALRGRAGVLDSRFLFYALQTAAVQAELGSRATGSTVLGIRQPELLRVCIPAPGYDEQLAIASTLGSLDSKIIANERVLNLLERLISARYEQLLLIGTRRVTVGEIADFHNRRRVPLSARERESRDGHVPYYGAAGLLGFVDEAIFDQPMVLVGEDGSVMTGRGTPVIQYIWGPSWVNNHAHALTGRGVATETLKIALGRSNVAHLVTGAVQPKISMGNLKTLNLEVPSDTRTIDELSGRCGAATQSIVDENKRLHQTRQSLLPLLTSGKITVNAAESLVEEVV